tara:strand:+ start:263 stop:2371 length:2109 start_codon:yes stop_codon:yes gene_type:complete
MNLIKKNIILSIIFLIISIILIRLILGQDSFAFDEHIYSENYDIVSNQLALKFFINDVWHFPLGKNPNYGMEVGNSVVFSEAIPILAFFAKLFKNFLPTNFQLISIWFVICFTLQLLLSYLIINNFTNRFFYSFVSALIFVFCPILLFRLPIHVALVAHWLILFCFYYEIKNFTSIRKETFYSFILSLSILIHFYFLPIILIIKYSFIIQDYFEKRNLKKNIREIIIPIISLLFVAYVSGYFQISVFDAMGYGYGNYSFNIAGLFDSQISNNALDWSLFFNDIKNSEHQHEGFSYLGIGGIFLFLALLINFFKTKNKSEYAKLPYILICLICFILSISNNVYLAGNLIFEYPLSKPIYGLLSIIRASGRFIWPVYYLILIFGIISIFKLFNHKQKSLIVISFILIVQIIDISPALKNYANSKVFNKVAFNNSNKKFWENTSKNFKTIRTTYYKNTSNIFPQISNQILKYNFLKSDIARLGRFDRKKASENRNKLYYDLNNKFIDSNTAYVIDNINHLRYLKYLYSSEDMGFFFIDNVWLMLPGYKNKMSKNDISELNKFNIVEIQENQKHLFIRDNLKNPLGLGWSFSKKVNGIWTEGNELNILFNFNRKKNKIYTVRLKLVSLITRPNQKISGFIKIGNKKLKSFEFKDLSNDFLEFEIPNLENKPYKIDIHINNPLSPIELLQSADGRMLGLLIESIEII